MPVIRMLMDMTGSRYDGQDWPGYKGLIEVPTWEAEQLTNAGNAEYADAPDLDRGYDVLKIAHPDYEEVLKHVDGSDQEQEDEYFEPDEDFSSEPDEDFDRRDDDFDRDEVVTDKVKPMKRPVTTDSKAEWIKWAVQNGAEERHSAEMTKAQLVAQFGKL